LSTNSLLESKIRKQLNEDSNKDKEELIKQLTKLLLTEIDNLPSNDFIDINNLESKQLPQIVKQSVINIVNFLGGI